MFYIQLAMGWETRAIASPAVPFSPSRWEPRTAQGLGAPVSPCDPTFLYFS